ncbi:hypothetical protein BZG02_01585 [Labilibaculum filiforme]|uniref:PKD domain-containing protein n=1 Tax=Labilibaculum filiforme TaxID=1940526 RepID=A0A2N3I5Z4_9BACT|nr:hypothetical protein BZG02_01585 [Labilibaculum filiforme]
MFSNVAFSQITAAKASFRTLTNYTTTVNDSLYVFCDNIGTGIGELKAASNDGTSGWNFTWTKWDSGTSDFTIPVSVENNQGESTLTNLSNGLYRVVVEKGSESYTDQAWVLNNSNTKPSTLVVLNCVGVNIRSSFTPNSLQYTNIDSKALVNVLSENDIVFWLQRNSENEFQKATYVGGEVSFFDLEAFEGESTYSIRVIDQYGCVFISDNVSTVTYKVEAAFSVDPMTGEAPLEVQFTNKSVNAEDFEWFIYQDYDRIVDAVSVEDSLLVDGIITDEDPLAYTYIHPGNYFVKLIASSNKGPETCFEEFNFKTEGTPIVVDTSLVQVPNVFTPNGDGRNDVFRVKSQSLKSFHAVLLNRWGRVVYEWRNPDEGWNGKVNGKWATPGTYYYVITATGREEQKKKYTKKGSFMLIRK